MNPQSRLTDRAVQDFRYAHRQAALQEVMSVFTGKSTSLLSFDEVSQQLRAGGGLDLGVQEIPLEAIGGSCGRYEDFTRTFLPRRQSDQDRWSRVRDYVSSVGLDNIPPISVFQIGDIYFVSDGNHRVSVARSLGVTRIKARVTKLETKVTLSVGDRPDDLILKAEYAEFLERLQPDDNWATIDLRMTVPGKYWIIEAQIEAHCYLIPGPAGEPISYQEAAVYWYEGVYLGVVQTIRDQGVLRDFPHRTETDLYVWLFEHRATLKESLEWDMEVGSVLTDLSVQHQPTAQGAVKRLQGRVTKGIVPGPLASGPETGLWQREKLAGPRESRLFYNVLVAVTGEAKGWQAFDQSLEIVRRERGRLHGLHLISSERDQQTAAVKALRAEFNRRCEAAQVKGKLSVEVGLAVDKICERSWLADVVVAPLLHPPGSKLVTRLSSEFRSLIQRCGRPVLALPDQPSALKQALLAYDGSSKGREALFVATYVAGRWGIPLVVLTVAAGQATESLEAEAKTYLADHGVQATFVQKSGPVAEAVLETGDAHAADLIIIGSYSGSPVKNLVLGSSVDELLSRSKLPILICR